MEFDAQVRRGLEMDLRCAIEENQLELYYQPHVTIADGAVRGFEVLLRWNHPKRGLLLPGDFIQCAEETGLIVPIGAWVLRTALSEAAHWPAGVRISINLSARQIIQDDLADTIEAALVESGQTGARLELEISEYAVVQHYAAAHVPLARLRALGVRISMDDFGTGYASLGHLRGFQFDRIKIDQSFIAGMMESKAGAAIVRAILQLASSLNIAATAEGVETQAQLEHLAAYGCDEAQGYFFSPPRPAAEITRLLLGRSLGTPSGAAVPGDFALDAPASRDVDREQR